MKILTARPHRLLGECVKRIGETERMGEPCMFLVPAQYTLQAEIEIMSRLNLRGSLMIDVLSPGRLQGRIFERAGQAQRTIFDERGKCMVLAGIVDEEKENLTVYRSAAENGTQGLVQKMSSLIADFKRSGQSAQEVMLNLEKLEEGSPARRKLTDAARIYKAYEEKMADRLADAEDVSREMCARMERSGVLDGQHVFVYGFDMITPTFAAELLHMAKIAKEVTLAVETDENTAPDGRLFAPVNFSLERLRKLARDQQVPLESERIDAEMETGDEIRLLERRLFALGGGGEEDTPQQIELRAASGMRQEVHVAAGSMRRMAAKGASCSEIAVVYPKGSGYAPLLANILPQYSIEAYIAEKRAAGSHPLCRFVLSSLAVIAGGWRAADIVECVRTGFWGLGPEEADALCAYCEGVDVRSEGFTKPFTYIKRGTPEELAALNESRERICGPLAAFGRALADAGSADDTVMAIVQLLEDVDAFETLAIMREELKNIGMDAEAEDCAQVWNQLMETLDQLHTMLGGQRVSTKTVLSLLRSGLSALELSALPPADGAVICGEIGNVRTAQVKTLFALGMNDTQGSAGGGLLTPAEQEEAARATGAYLGMSDGERAALAQLDELKALSGARERLVVSYALADETGRALREGEAVQALKRLFPKMPVRGGLPEQEQEAMLCAPVAALDALAVHLSDAADGRQPLDARYAQAYAAIARSEHGRERLAGVTRRLGEEPEKRLDGAQARSLYGRPVMSVSRLETFAQCPYRHFIRYGLAPQEPLEPGIDRAELGTLYHEAAERFTRAVTALPEFPEVDAAVCDRLMDEAVKPLIEEWRMSPLGESARGAAIAKRIRRTAQRAGRSIITQFADSRFRPMRTELVFGQNGVAPIMMELADGTFVYLQGRIDRVDVMEGGRIRVVDYKSGSRKFDPTMAYWGIQLQLLIYLAAALAQVPGSKAAGFFYCRIADPTIKSESRVKEEIERQIAKKLSLAGISLSDVEVLRAQDGLHAAMITKEGKPSGTYRASMADEEGMDAMVGFAKRKASQLAGAAYDGVIDDSPAERGQYSACASCDYAAICGFDPTRRAGRRLAKKTVEDLR